MKTTTTLKQQTRGFASIASGDGRFRLWLPRPTATGLMVCNCGFGLRSHLPFVDAIDQLDYVKVAAVNQLDQDFSTIVLQCLEQPYAVCVERLMEDIPNLMEEHL